MALIGGGGSSSTTNTRTAAGSYYGNTNIGHLPSYDTGTWSVPSDMVANVHQNELIAPTKYGAADMVRSILSGQTNVGGFHFAPSININGSSLDGRDFVRYAKDNSHSALSLHKNNNLPCVDIFPIVKS